MKPFDEVVDLEIVGEGCPAVPGSVQRHSELAAFRGQVAPLQLMWGLGVKHRERIRSVVTP